ncbi:MarR family winged helix-turn-helix transcriptional regulator [Microbacterium hominis]|uniref:MarR family transcriptional regulator n=1 Tax=Microbacterium hominis TaxID=162426 RepID=A0A7D4U6S9_9MICO|nr:MarR family transcriptional regulator [Microbacterium hominis]QKJ18606.1 MarR family transcriptional regulator [Microbacterium hominis]
MPQTVMRHEGEHLYSSRPQTGIGEKLSAAILRLRSSERIQAERAQRASGLSSVDLLALRYLVQGWRDERRLSPKDLIFMLDTSSATVTNVVERLVKRGYVTREQHPTDRRAHFLLPTEDAVDCVDQAYSGRDSAVVGVIDGLTDAEAEIATDVIARLASALDAVSDMHGR